MASLWLVLFLGEGPGNAVCWSWEMHWCHWCVWVRRSQRGAEWSLHTLEGLICEPIDILMFSLKHLSSFSQNTSPLRVLHWIRTRNGDFEALVYRWSHSLWQRTASGRCAEDRLGSHRLCGETSMAFCTPKDSSQRIMSTPARPEGARNGKKTG